MQRQKHLNYISNKTQMGPILTIIKVIKKVLLELINLVVVFGMDIAVLRFLINHENI